LCIMAFSSLAWLYYLTGKTRFIAQLLVGINDMGANKLIYIRFYSDYLMLSHKAGKHRVSLRYDYFKVDEDDTTAIEPKSSHGEGLSATWSY
ncbi:hypothetical protein CWC17_19210, partial [Pseudoalteromonas sp. S3785]